MSAIDEASRNRSSDQVTGRCVAGRSETVYSDIVQRYIDLWNMADDERAAAIDQICVTDMRYVDPNISTRGLAELSRYIGLTRRHFGGSPFRVVTPVDGHHDQVRFRWECGPPGAAPRASGSDVALLRDGALAAIYGFFD